MKSLWTDFVSNDTKIKNLDVDGVAPYSKNGYFKFVKEEYEKTIGIMENWLDKLRSKEHNEDGENKEKTNKAENASSKNEHDDDQDASRTASMKV
jgi:hypothetical protein